MKPILPFHHYSSAHAGARLPIEALEEEVVALLLASPVQDTSRDSSIAFELKHSSAVTQFARLLALRRNLPVDVCAAGALLHDIYVITTGSYADHAHQGMPIARSMMEASGGFTEAEIADAEAIVWHHSDKHLFADDPFAEFGKDVDVLDAFLYPGAFDWYLVNKPLHIFRYYLQRAAAVQSDLSLPACAAFSLLSDHDDGWLQSRLSLSARDIADAVDSDAPCIAAPPFLVVAEDGMTVCFSDRGWSDVARHRGLSGAGEAVRRVVPSVMQRVPQDMGARAIMVWPAIDRFEILDDSPAGIARLAELRSASPGVQA